MIVYAINDYVWKLLQVYHQWTEIRGLRPFLPAQQQPEFMDAGKPFMLYASSAEYNNGRLESEDSEIISYAVFANTSEEADEAVETIKNAFKAFNSADNITKWVKQSSTLGDQDRHTVTFTEVMDRETSGVVQEEGGKSMAVVSVRVGYKTEPIDYDLT